MHVKIFHYINMLICVLLGYFVFNLFAEDWSNKNIENLTPRAVYSQTVQGAQIVGSDNNVRDILTYNLFLAQRQSGQTKNIDASSQNIPISKLSYVLQGTILNSDPTKSYAIVMVENKSNIYTVGQALKQWEIVGIEREAILIKNGAKLERLLLRKNKQMTGGGQSVALNRREFSALFQNPVELLSSVSIVPYDNEGTKGLEITSLAADSLIRKLKLLPNDVLVSINNTPLQGLNSLKYLQNIFQQNEAELRIIRQNKPLLLKYTIR